MRSLNLSIVIFILIAAMSFAVSAQVTGGAVTGTVLDPNGAVVPNATIKMSNRERGQEFTGQTSADGIFLFPNVPVGNYTVKISAPGFGESTREVVVTLNQ